MTAEVQGGLARPLQMSELASLLEQYLPRIHQAHDDTEVLRNRIQNGERSIAQARAGKIQGLSEQAIAEAEVLLTSLRQELAHKEWWMITALGMALAHGVGTIVAEASRDEGWSPPPGSVLRIVMPGHLNLAVDLT